MQNKNGRNEILFSFPTCDFVVFYDASLRDKCAYVIPLDFG